MNNIKNILFEFIPNKKNKELITNFIKFNDLAKIKKKDFDKKPTKMLGENEDEDKQ